MRGFVVTLATLLVLLSAAQAAEAAWTISPRLSPDERSGSAAQVAIDDNGDGFVAWQLNDTMTTRIQVRFRAAGGQLGPLGDISTLSVPATSPRIGILPSGNAYVVWREWDGSYWRIKARTVSPTGVLSSVRVISKAGRDAHSPQLAVAPSGQALIGWRSLGRVVVRMRNADNTLSAWQTLPGTAEIGSGGPLDFPPEVGIDSDGDGVIAWRTPQGKAVAIRRAADGSLGPLETLAPNSRPPQLAVNSAGDATVVRESGGSVIGRQWSAAGVLGPDLAIGLYTNDRPLDVEVDAAGNAVVVWQDQSRLVETAVSAAGSVGPQQTVSTGTPTGSAETGIDAAGDVQILWGARPGGTGFTVYARQLLADGTLTPIQTVVGQDGPADLAVAPDGSALAPYYDDRGERGDWVRVAAGP